MHRKKHYMNVCMNGSMWLVAKKNALSAQLEQKGAM